MKFSDLVISPYSDIYSFAIDVNITLAAKTILENKGELVVHAFIYDKENHIKSYHIANGIFVLKNKYAKLKIEELYGFRIKPFNIRKMTCVMIMCHETKHVHHEMIPYEKVKRLAYRVKLDNLMFQTDTIHVVACEYCGKRTSELQKCSRCCTTRYCNKECQIAHWSIHKLQCVLPKPHK